MRHRSVLSSLVLGLILSAAGPARSAEELVPIGGTEVTAGSAAHFTLQVEGYAQIELRVQLDAVDTARAQAAAWLLRNPLETNEFGEADVALATVDAAMSDDLTIRSPLLTGDPRPVPTTTGSAQAIVVSQNLIDGAYPIAFAAGSVAGSASARLDVLARSLEDGTVVTLSSGSPAAARMYGDSAFENPLLEARAGAAGTTLTRDLEIPSEGWFYGVLSMDRGLGRYANPYGNTFLTVGPQFTVANGPPGVHRFRVHAQVGARALSLLAVDVPIS